MGIAEDERHLWAILDLLEDHPAHRRWLLDWIRAHEPGRRKQQRQLSARDMMILHALPRFNNEPADLSAALRREFGLRRPPDFVAVPGSKIWLLRRILFLNGNKLRGLGPGQIGNIQDGHRG